MPKRLLITSPSPSRVSNGHLQVQSSSEDESDGSVDDNGYTVKNKPRNSLEPKIPKSVSGIDPIIPKSVSGINKKCLAALNPNNLNLIYLRRTLVVKLLTELDTFEQKVIGCLVRVKNDLKSYTYMMTKKYYQIGLVTGNVQLNLLVFGWFCYFFSILRKALIFSPRENIDNRH